MPYTSAEEFDQAYKDVKAAFASGITKDKAWRRQQLKRAWIMVEENKERIFTALQKDLHKHRLEALVSDVSMLQTDIVTTLDNLDRWTAPDRPSRKDLLNFVGRTTVRKEPLGVTLILGAWNYPVLMALMPMVAAIAAGCAVVVKPSDVTVHTEELLAEIVPKYMDQRAIRCVTAGAKEMGRILERRFDHIFYTGSSHVGRIIYAAAAKHLTPVTLELGGQAPAIVCKSADIDTAAKRIAATKFSNAGQICINVNHVFVDPSVRQEFVSRLTHYFDLYRDGTDDDLRPDSYSHIVNDRNFARLSALLDSTRGKVVYGGVHDAKTRFFSPTVIVNVSTDDPLFSEELFGPIVPIVDADLDTAVEYTAAGERPLALYAFTTDKREKERILEGTSSGGMTFNDCLLHSVAFDAPFGGVGGSGFGSYHGHYGILAFSHLRTVFEGPPSFFDALTDFRYPPYSDAKMKKFLQNQVVVSFDNKGNKKRAFGYYVQWGLGMVFAGIAWVFGV